MQINFFIKTFLLFLSLSFISCSSAKFASNAGHMNSQDYQKRKKLEYSLFGNGTNPMTEQDIKKILNSKISLPKKIRIGVIKLESESHFSSSWQASAELMSNKTFILNKELKDNFFGKIKKSKRVKDITIFPSMMVPSPMSVQALRESAVRLQVDILLVLKSENFADYEYVFFSTKDKARTLSTVEAILLDVRTGVIPFTSIATDSAELEENDKDMNHFQLIRRSAEKAETKALIEVADSLYQFINSIP